MGPVKISTDKIQALKEIVRSPTFLESPWNLSSNNPFEEYCKSFRESRETLEHEILCAIHRLSNETLIAAFLTWIEDMHAIHQDIGKYAHILVQEKFLEFFDEENQLLPLNFVKYSESRDIIDKIRCRRDLSLDLREQLVNTYLIFTRWVENETHGYVERTFDPDEVKRQGRAIDYSMFIKLLQHLDDKMQVVAKLLYFGGSRTLDEVLSLDLKDVNYEEKVIRYNSQLISYPTHVFADLKAITQDRKKSSGRVFVGRQNANLNPATVFRKFREAASRIGLGDSFTHKSLTTNQ